MRESSVPGGTEQGGKVLGAGAGSGSPSWPLAAKLSRLLAGKGVLTGSSPKKPLPSGTASKGTGGLLLLWLVKASRTERTFSAWGALVAAGGDSPGAPSPGLSPVPPCGRAGRPLVLPVGRRLWATGDWGGLATTGRGKGRPKQGLAGERLSGMPLAPGMMSWGCRKGGAVSQVPVGADVASGIFVPKGTTGKLPTVLGRGVPGATARRPSAENSRLRPGPAGNHRDTGVKRAPAGPGHPYP